MAKTYNTISTFTAGQVLTAAQMNDLGENSNNYRVPPACILQRTSAQSIPSGAVTRVEFDSESVDTDTLGTTGASAEIVLKTAGIYAITWNGYFDGASSGGTSYRQGWVDIDGDRWAWHRRDPADERTALGGSIILSMAGTETIGLYVIQNSGGAKNFQPSSGLVPTLSVVWIGQAS